MRDQALSVPVVRLEVEYMKHSILHAFTEYSAKVDADVKAAVERVCQPENLRRIINEAADAEIEHAIEDEIRNFFRYGKGHQFLANVVKEKLEKEIEYRSTAFEPKRPR